MGSDWEPPAQCQDLDGAVSVPEINLEEQLAHTEKEDKIVLLVRILLFP